MKNLILIIALFGIFNGATAQSNHFEMTKRSPFFPNGAADQVAYIDLGDIHIWGWLEVTLTGHYSNQNNVGKYTRRYEVGKNLGNGFFYQSSEVPAAFGLVANQWKLGDMERNSQNHLIIPIYHLVSTGNFLTVNIRGVSVTNFDQSLFTITIPSAIANTETKDVVSVKNGMNIDGDVGIGTTNTDGWKLAVSGKVRAKEINVETEWSDFVFENDYKLPTLQEVENHIKEKGHLQDIPSAKEVAENGIYLGEMDSKLLQKIEELTLYAIAQDKKIKELQLLNKKLIDLQSRLEKLESKK